MVEDFVQKVKHLSRRQFKEHIKNMSSDHIDFGQSTFEELK
jgi:hypothetical protein